MNKHKKLVFFLPILPMLMANAPAPRAYPKEYKDFEVSIVKEESYSSTAYPYAYTYHIKNTGVGYIDMNLMGHRQKGSRLANRL